MAQFVDEPKCKEKGPGLRGRHMGANPASAFSKPGLNQVALNQGFSHFKVHTSFLEDLVTMQSLIQQVWGET